ncbi:bacteriocin biosynthesis cyclodehydratase domain-containing protein [Jatrophihabitans endophyticus]|uniref:Bacteriocin biosynthesis cyclodehydratase domain-containing protein n=1 Tax=Jatrophihabitans endophyticus TaxID=1206085 RepID=A0A1M5GL11_9ACTN|nr:TOMM precursor leader peptide-binding protein [Jatrophihabitans endophyticus]SHG04397.1 bacteriocin biosynthesis cyclodehydratase domain-containing protein [Jatrophihabitans endophyticus]
MLLPSVRLVETPDSMHFFDGRRLVSLQVDDAARSAVRRALERQHPVAPVPPAHLEHAPSPSGDDVDDARRLLTDLDLAVPDGGMPWHGEIGADYAATTAFGATSPRGAADRLATTTVNVLSDDAAALAAMLAESGLRCRVLDGPAAIASLDAAHDVVLATDSDDTPTRTLREVNAACLAARVAWLPITAYDGAVLHVGPLVVPGATACFECTVRRRAANTEYADLYDGVVSAVAAAPTPRALRAWSYAVASLCLLHWIGNRDQHLPGQLLTLDPAGMALRQARVFRVPRCVACAGPDYTVAAAPWELARDH